MENDNVNVDTSNDTEDVETVETTEPEFTETEKKLYARAKKAEAELKDLRSKPIIKEVNERETVKPSDILRSEEFKLHRMGYNETEIDLVMNNGGMRVLEDSKSPLVLGLQASREQRKAEEAASMAQDTSGMSELERKYTKADLEKMSTAELEKILPHAN